MKYACIEFVTDYGSIWLSDPAAEKLHDLMLLSASDGRKRGVMQARKDLLKWEITMNNFAALAYELGIKPDQVILQNQ